MYKILHIQNIIRIHLGYVIQKPLSYIHDLFVNPKFVLGFSKISDNYGIVKTIKVELLLLKIF